MKMECSVNDFADALLATSPPESPHSVCICMALGWFRWEWSRVPFSALAWCAHLMVRLLVFGSPILGLVICHDRLSEVLVRVLNSLAWPIVKSFKDLSTGNLVVLVFGFVENLAILCKWSVSGPFFFSGKGVGLVYVCTAKSRAYLTYHRARYSKLF